MASPSGFVNFAEYLGLNKEAGEQMTERLMGEGNKLRDEANAASDSLYASASEAGEGGETNEKSYVGAQERVRRGLTSYGKFMGGLNDPAERQVLMEKLYGKGSVSWLDSALAGGAGAGTFARGQDELAQTQRTALGRGVEAEAFKGERAALTAKIKDKRTQMSDEQQSRVDEDEKRLISDRYARSIGHSAEGGAELRRSSGGRNPDGSRIYTAYRTADGREDVDRGWSDYLKSRDPAHKKEETWAEYYAKNKRKGAK